MNVEEIIEPELRRTADYLERRGSALRVPSFAMPNPIPGAEPVLIVHIDWMTTGFVTREDGDNHEIGIMLADTRRAVGMVHYMTPEEAVATGESLIRMADPEWRMTAEKESTPHE
jgi:hypothetical protein